MKLRELLLSTKVGTVRGSLDSKITAIAYDSRSIEAPGALFVALPGEKVDGAAFVVSAIQNGAIAIVHQGSIKLANPPPPNATYVEVEDSRRALADLSAKFYGYPSRSLKLIGITGTNGKTTTSYLIKHICDHAGLPCGLIGTVSYQFGNGESIPSVRTTPESADLQKLLARVVDVGSKAVAMEVSSHAIANHRIAELEFNTAVFTNLTQDHLDFHRGMSDYFDTKSSFFTDHLPSQNSKAGAAVVNADDPYGSRLLHRIPKSVPVTTYGVKASSDFRASNIQIGVKETSYQLDAIERTFLVKLPLIGRFNIYNSLAALAATAGIGVPVRTAVAALRLVSPIPGRLQAVSCALGFQVFVDYAHSEDALRNVLTTLKDLKPRRLVTVFGCGGNRDRSKRPLMAQAVESCSDFAVVTSDNPRHENPTDIIADVTKGFGGRNYEIVPDRRQAIKFAIDQAEAGDILLIAGKGHESYQEVADKIIPFDDVEVAREAISAKSQRSSVT